MRTFDLLTHQEIHYALRKLAKEVLPAYEADGGELTPAQLAAIRKAIPQGRAKSTKSSLFCVFL